MDIQPTTAHVLSIRQRLFRTALCGLAASAGSLPCSYLVVLGSLDGNVAPSVCGIFGLGGLIVGLAIGSVLIYLRAPLALGLIGAVYAFPAGLGGFSLVYTFLNNGLQMQPMATSEILIIALIVVSVSAVLGLMPTVLWYWRVAIQNSFSKRA